MTIDELKRQIAQLQGRIGQLQGDLNEARRVHADLCGRLATLESPHKPGDIITHGRRKSRGVWLGMTPEAYARKHRIRNILANGSLGADVEVWEVKATGERWDGPFEAA